MTLWDFPPLNFFKAKTFSCFFSPSSHMEFKGHFSSSFWHLQPQSGILKTGTLCPGKGKRNFANDSDHSKSK